MLLHRAGLRRASEYPRCETSFAHWPLPPKGLIRFEGGVQAYYYSTTNNYELAGGEGGALWNGETGRVVFKGKIDMGDDRNLVSCREGLL